jgi:cholesterol oxidase
VREPEKRFDAVVVGSGFGGSVMAYRLADAKLDVCLLERGKAWPPGSFPRTPLEFANALWDPDKGLHGLYDVWSFRGLSALVSSGVGGGSLIYANVLLEKDEEWFTQEPGAGNPWPIRYADLEQHYCDVRKMLDPVEFPQHLHAKAPKTAAFRRAAAARGLEAFGPPLAVTFSGEGEELGRPFGNPADNFHRAQRYTCRLVGACDAGCNYGSKNSVDLTYVSLAERAGADIRCRHEVKAFERCADGSYRVEVVDHSDAVDGVRPLEPPRRYAIYARRLILAAGALGTPYLLLTNRIAFPHISRHLGTRFTGNGDLLTFAARCNQVLEPARGPVITSAVRIPDVLGRRPPGHFVEDGGYPAICAAIAEMLEAPRIVWAAREVELKLLWRWLTGRRERNLSFELSELLGDRSLSAGTLPLLGMGREPPQGRMRIVDGKLDIDWSFRRAAAYFAGVRNTMRAIAEELGGRLESNVLWRLNAVITVHPVGGCPLGRTADEGVVHPETGEVHNYARLHVADGSVMPGPVGANPSLTIAALADRFATNILREEGRA